MSNDDLRIVARTLRDHLHGLIHPLRHFSACFGVADSAAMVDLVIIWSRDLTRCQPFLWFTPSAAKADLRFKTLREYVQML